MKVWLLNLWNDPAAFRSAVRSVIVLISTLIVQGVIVLPAGEKYAWFTALFTGAAAMAVPAGQTNRTAGEIKQMAQDPNVVPAPPPEKP